MADSDKGESSTAKKPETKPKPQPQPKTSPEETVDNNGEGSSKDREGQGAQDDTEEEAPYIRPVIPNITGHLLSNPEPYNGVYMNTMTIDQMDRGMKAFWDTWEDRSLSSVTADDSDAFDPLPDDYGEDLEKDEPDVNEEEEPPTIPLPDPHAARPPAPFELVFDMTEGFGDPLPPADETEQGGDNEAEDDGGPDFIWSIAESGDELEDRSYHDSVDGDEDDDDDEYGDDDDDATMDSDGDEEEEEEEDQFIQLDSDDSDIDHAGGMRILAALRNGEDPGPLTREALVALMRNRSLTRVLFQDDAIGDIAFLNSELRRARHPRKDPNRFPKVPSPEGRRLMVSGAFGVSDFDRRVKKPLSIRMLESELALGDHVEQKRNRGLIAQSLLPCDRAEQIIHFEEPVYSGQFSADGNFFYAASQDFRVRMYNTANPYDWKYYKTVAYPAGQWTLTDATLSRDNKWLAFTSIAPLVAIAPTDPADTGDPYYLDLDSGPALPGREDRSFGIWSVRFSGDGRELVAGTSANSINVFDIESRTVLHHFAGHHDHVNAVCFADKSSPHIIYSGSDDTTIKVWDRRSMGDGREAGAFAGHVEGLTYIDSKDDGRYILSNAKDQSMKLWDLRMAMSAADPENISPSRHARHQSRFDYRSGRYNDYWWDPHPNDNSLVTFRGHKVLRTLIRCHFSPPNSSNSRYVYTGSADGKVYIYNMDATLERTVDVQAATEGTQSNDSTLNFYRFGAGPGWSTCVRDASWHPNAPMLVASAWNGYTMNRGTLSSHSINSARGDEAGPLGRSVDHKLRRDPRFTDSKFQAEYDSDDDDDDNDDGN